MTGTNNKEHSALETVAEMFGKISSDRIALVGLMMLHERTTRQAGYKFFQRVFVRYRGRAAKNYLSNFMAAHVLQANEKFVVLCSSDAKTILTYPNTGIDEKDIFSLETFRPMRKEMIEKGNRVDPDLRTMPTPKRLVPQELEEVRHAVESSKGDVTDIDSVYKRSKKKRKAKGEEQKPITLAELADALLNGQIDVSDVDRELDLYNGLGDIDDYGDDGDSDGGSDYSVDINETETESGTHIIEM